MATSVVQLPLMCICSRRLRREQVMSLQTLSISARHLPKWKRKKQAEMSGLEK